jgi:Trk K+ transport system NAD-binding subunit
MNTTRRKQGDDPTEAAQNVLVIGGNHFGLAVAEYLSESARSVTFISEEQPTDGAPEVTQIHRKLTDTNDVRALASEVTDVDLVVVLGSDSEALLLGHLVRRELGPCDVVAGLSDPTTDPAFEGTGVDRIDISRLLAEQIRDRYR